MHKIALITGISGQDGRHLVQILHERGYTVHGLLRGGLARDINLDEEMPFVIFHDGDVTDYSSVYRALYRSVPNEIYHLAAMTFVPMSWSTPVRMVEVNTLGTLNVLEAVRNACPSARVLFAGSSEAFGNSPAPQNEQSPMKPTSVYGLTKLDGLHLCRLYRDHYDLYVSAAISFNHESPIRPIRFVTRKITNTLAKIKLEKEKVLKLGNLDAYRDWGYAKDYVEMMVSILQLEAPQDFVIGTGETHSVQEWVTSALRYFHLPGFVVETDEYLKRPEDINELRAANFKLKAEFIWNPMKFDELVHMMCKYDLELENGEDPSWLPMNISQPLSVS